MVYIDTVNALNTEEVDTSSTERKIPKFLSTLSRKPNRFEAHAALVLKRLNNRKTLETGQNVNADKEQKLDETEEKVEKSPSSESTDSTLDLDELPKCTVNENGETVVPRKTQPTWCRGITCDAPMRDNTRNEASPKVNLKPIQETVMRRMSSPMMCREKRLLCDSEAMERVERVISASDCSTAWLPGHSDGGSSNGQSSDGDEEAKNVVAPTAAAEAEEASAPNELERSMSERPLLVREKRWSTDYLSRLSSSLDTIDPGMEKLMRVWPQDVSELLQRPVDSVLYPTAKEVPMTEQLKFQSGAFSIPHPEKAMPGGADSYFASENGLSLGVADGVGEWEWRFGINARAFADELMNGCQDHLKDMTDMKPTTGLGPSQHALKALQNGFQSTKSFGSSTALVAALNRSGRLGVANLGDSALLLLRRKEVDATSGFRCLSRTREQQHAFNCPYQLSLLPKPADFPALLEQGKEKLVRAIERRPNSKTDCPYDADLFDFQVQEGDLLVLGTDGVFDNLYVEEVCELAGAAVGPLEADASHITEAAQIAQAIAKAAFHRSLDRVARSPFSDHAKQAGLYHTGGKMDDITCVCAWILAETDADM